MEAAKRIPGLRAGLRKPAHACDTLFTLSYIIKLKIVRVDKDADYKVNPLEVSWHLDKSGNVTEFDWRAMIMQPDIVTADDFIKAVSIAKELGKQINFDKAKYESIAFGRCVQCFHQGDYNNMNATMYKMQDFARENGYDYDLYTHDIYLNDSRKTKMDNLKTIMRIGVSSNHDLAGTNMNASSGRFATTFPGGEGFWAAAYRSF